MTSGELSWRGRRFGAISAGPLGVRNFQLLSMGQLTSTVGDYCYAVALPWLVLSDHGGTLLLGTVLACYGVPRTVLIPFGGVLADRLSPRTVMLAADACRCVLVAVLAVLAARHIDSLLGLAPVAALLGAGEGVFLPASYSITPSLLPAGQLPAGNAVSTAMVQLGSLAGPVIGGLLVASAGPAPAFAVDAASFAISAVALALISRAPSQPAAATRTPRCGPDDNKASAPQVPAKRLWRIVRGSRFLQILLVVSVIANFTSAGAFEVALPALAHASYGATGYGALEACFGFGALAGVLVAARMKVFPKPAAAACGAYLMEATAICLLPFLGGLPGAAVAIAIAGVCNGFGNIVLVTLVQQWAPPQSLGRIMSLLMLAAFGAFPISVALAGVLVRHLHAAPFFPVAGITLGVAILLALVQRDFRDFGSRSADQSD